MSGFRPYAEDLAAWRASGSPSFAQQCAEAEAKAWADYDRMQLARLGPQAVAEIEAARAQPQEQDEAA